jgi:hypothetical protein
MPPAYLRGPTNVLPSVSIAYWCAGKEQFDNPGLAAEIAARSKRGPRGHYWCRTCRSFHVGSEDNAPPPKGIADELVRAR